jgi:hypothetical protein
MLVNKTRTLKNKNETRGANWKKLRTPGNTTTHTDRHRLPRAAKRSNQIVRQENKIWKDSVHEKANLVSGKGGGAEARGELVARSKNGVTEKTSL